MKGIPNKVLLNIKGIMLMLLLTFALVGCASKQNETTTGKGNEEPSQVSEDEKYGGTLKIVFGQNMVNIGLPPLIRAGGDILASMTTYETLARFNEAGEAVPWLAEGWESSFENKTITIELKQGIQFHDGTDFNAEAVKWNLELFRDKGRVEASAIESIDVLDDYTLQLNLSRWENNIFDNLFCFAQMASPTAFKEKGEEWLQDHPVGTGPFVFGEWNRDQKVTFKRNENYWKEGLPYLDGVEFHTINESSTAEASMIAGEYDLYMYTPAQVAHNLKNDFQVEILESSMGSTGFSLAPSSEDPNSPLADANVRKAIGYAIDKQAIVDTVFYGYAEATHQWSVEKAANFNKDVEGTPYDPDKSKELLEAAGYGDGFDLTVTFTNKPELIQMYTAIQAYLADVGINLELNGVQTPEWQEMSGSNGSWDGLIHSVFRISNDIIFDFNRSLAADSSHYRQTKLNEEAEELLKKADTLANSEEVIDLSHQLQKVIFDDHQNSIPLLVTGSILTQNGNVQDHGLLKTQLTEWRPETTWLKK